MDPQRYRQLLEFLEHAASDPDFFNVANAEAMAGIVEEINKAIAAGMPVNSRHMSALARMRDAANITGGNTVNQQKKEPVFGPNSGYGKEPPKRSWTNRNSRRAQGLYASHFDQNRQGRQGQGDFTAGIMGPRQVLNEETGEYEYDRRDVKGETKTIGNVNYSAIEAFNRMPPQVQAQLAAQGMAPSYSQFSTSSGQGGQGSSLRNRGTMRLQSGVQQGPNQFNQGFGTSQLANNALRQQQALQPGLRGGGFSQPGGPGALGQPPSRIGNTIHNQNTGNQMALDQLRQRAAAGGDLDRFNTTAGNFLGASRQGLENAKTQRGDIEFNQRLQEAQLGIQAASLNPLGLGVPQQGLQDFII